MSSPDSRPYEVLVAAMGSAALDFARERRLRPRVASLDFRPAVQPRHAGFGVVAP